MQQAWVDRVGASKTQFAIHCTQFRSSTRRIRFLASCLGMLSVYASAGTIQTISPSNGPYAGGNQILITGQNLGNGSDITNIVICGIRASISTQSSTQVVVWAGSKGVGTGPVTVYSTSQGVSSQTSGYTYNPPGVIGQRIPGNVIAGD